MLKHPERNIRELKDIPLKEFNHKYTVPDFTPEEQEYYHKMNMDLINEMNCKLMNCKMVNGHMIMQDDRPWFLKWLPDIFK